MVLMAVHALEIDSRREDKSRTDKFAPRLPLLLGQNSVELLVELLQCLIVAERGSYGVGKIRLLKGAHLPAPFLRLLGQLPALVTAQVELPLNDGIIKGEVTALL